MRHLAFALCLAGLTAGTAAAKPARPVDGAIAPTPVPLELVRGAGPAADHVQQRAAALVACAQKGRATFLRMRASLRWNGRGTILRANSYGGSAAVNRCVAKVLGGSIAGVTGRGTAQVAYTIRRPAIVIAPVPVPAPAPRPTPIPERPAPKPKAPSKDALLTCQIDSDCTLHFQIHACVSGDPVAVNKLDLDAVRAAFPVRHLACGMGGPQYDELRDSNENRWSASCEQSRCTLHEHPPSPRFKP